MSNEGEDPRIPDMRKREALLVHIEGLQTSLTKRNERIAELENKIAGEGESEVLVRMQNKAYKAGYKACASNLMRVKQDTINTLSALRDEAFKEYLVGDNGGRQMDVY